MKISGTTFYLLLSEEIPEGEDADSSDFLAVVLDKEEDVREKISEIFDKGVSLDAVEVSEVDLSGEEGWTVKPIMR